jgi:trk system potassium uptake protein TrkA
MHTPPEFAGRSLRELGLRNMLNVQLVAIQRGEGPAKQINIIPKADDILRDGDLLILIGANEHLDRIREIAQAPLKKPR